MKVLVNGGLNMSTLDGWWEEAYAPGLGWAIGDSHPGTEAEQDQSAAGELYALLEREVVPAFYSRDATGVPRAWMALMGRSMTDLTPHYSATRMVREYLDKAYLPAAQTLRARYADSAAAAKGMAVWDRHLRHRWPGVHIGKTDFTRQETGWEASVPIYPGEIAVTDVRVEVYADGAPGESAEIITLSGDGPVPGTSGGFFYRGRIAGTRPAGDYTVRVVPSRSGVRVPSETALIHWQK